MKRIERVTRAACLFGACVAVGLFAASCSDDDDDNGTNPTDDFVFATDAPGAYARVDRMGMPAVATAVIPSARKNTYNDSDPADDAAGDFLADISASVTGLHAALDDDLVGAGLDPATTEETLSQAGPLIVPDVLSIDIDAASGFPNGRRITDEVIDITLAVVLLDLQTHTAGTLIGVLNPTENDKSFLPQFPYLAAPFTP